MIRILFLFLLSYSSLFALSSIMLSEPPTHLTNFNVELYEEHNKELSIDQIQGIERFRWHTNTFNFKNKHPNIWIKFNVINNSNHPQTSVIHFSESAYDSVRFYTIHEGNVTDFQEVGIRIGKDKNTKPIFSIYLEAQEIKNIYIRISAPYISNYKINIDDKSSYDTYTQEEKQYYMLFVGILLALGFYAFINYLLNKNAAYLYYLLYIFSILYWQLSLNTIAPLNTIYSADSFYFFSLSIAPIIIFLGLYVRKMIDFASEIKSLDLLLKLTIVLYLPLAIAVYITDKVSYDILNLASLIVLAILIFSTLLAYLKNSNHLALMLTIAQVIFFSPYMMHTLMLAGEIEYDYTYKQSLLIGTFIEVVIFAFLLMYKSKLLEKRDNAITTNTPKTSEEQITVKPTTQSLEENNFEYLFNNTLEAILLFEDEICVDINESGVKLFDLYDKNEAIGSHISKFITVNSLKRVLLLQKSKKQSSYEIDAIKSNKELFTALYKSYYKYTDDAKIQIASFVDLSYMKEKEIHLEHEKKKAEESTKMKSEFLANMSHEIRTPMNGIIGMSHLMQQTKLDIKQKNFIRKIDDSAKSLLGVIDDILDHSKIEAGKLIIDNIPFDMHELIENTLNVVRVRAEEKEIEIIVHYDESASDNFYGDSLRIGQVLKNLVSNAIKFTQIGTVEISFKKLEHNSFQFTVKDSGIGIKPEKIKTLFQDFTQAENQTSRVYGGTGLGLSISKRLVELMDGRIWIESEEGEGSKFSFELPLVELEKDAISLKNEKLDPNSINVLIGSKILLVDDNVINQEIILGLLENSGIHIDIANNGEECVEQFQRHDYELILMDIHMPVMNGYEATLIIRESNADIPIIALTANAMKEDVDRTIAAGMNEHLNKPIDVNKLYETLLKYITPKVDSYDPSIDTDEVDLPQFKYIDAETGLEHLGGNKSLYFTILKDFCDEYQDFKLKEDNPKELKMQVHTLKGLSASIGANALHEITLRVEESYDSELLKLLYMELNFVVSELDRLDEKLGLVEVELLETTVEHIKSLFSDLKSAIQESRPKKVVPIIAEIDKYKLTPEYEHTYEKVKKLALNYEYQKAEKLL